MLAEHLPGGAPQVELQAQQLIQAMQDGKRRTGRIAITVAGPAGYALKCLRAIGTVAPTEGPAQRAHPGDVARRRRVRNVACTSVRDLRDRHSA